MRGRYKVWLVIEDLQKEKDLEGMDTVRGMGNYNSQKAACEALDRMAYAAAEQVNP